MAQEAVREDVSSCPYKEMEVAFVAAIDFSLVRDTKMHGVSARELLLAVIKPLSGVFKAHLERLPRKCLETMVELLDVRMDTTANKQPCHSWSELLSMAVDPWRERSSHHYRHCPFCQRDVRQIAAKLPYYNEFQE